MQRQLERRVRQPRSQSRRCSSARRSAQVNTSNHYTSQPLTLGAHRQARSRRRWLAFYKRALRERRRLHVLHGRRVQARRGDAAARAVRRLAAVDRQGIAPFKDVGHHVSRRRSSASASKRGGSRAARRSSASSPIRRSSRSSRERRARRPTCSRSRCATSCARSWARPTTSRSACRSRCRSAAAAASRSASAPRPRTSTAMIERVDAGGRSGCSRKGRPRT